MKKRRALISTADLLNSIEKERNHIAVWYSLVYQNGPSYVFRYHRAQLSYWITHLRKQRRAWTLWRDTETKGGAEVRAALTALESEFARLHALLLE